MTVKLSAPRSRRWMGAIAATALLVPAATSAAFADDPQPAKSPVSASSGKTAATAAASCWEIAQNDPDAESGTYWLATPAMGAPERFHCDQETDGGGWALVGRGREGWSEAVIGSGTPEQVRTNITGPDAFAPRQLPGDTIDALNNDNPIHDLPDGVRLHRATNAAGTRWQDAQFTLASPRDTWTWQFDNEQRVASYSFDGTRRNGGSTSSFGWDDGLHRARTVTGSAEGWKMGFGYGGNIAGSPSPSSFLWSKTSGTGHARPFTQVYVRPKLRSSDLWSPIPDSGTAAIKAPAVARAFAKKQTWGVSGLGAGPSTLEGSNEVSAFAESDNRVFVGGNFTRVQQSAGGSGQQQQSYLAAFDRDSGNWVSSFRPTFDNQVKAIAALPGGRIAVGGYFTKVNDQPRTGLVVLDATTGQIDETFTGRLVNALSGGIPVVRALDVQGEWLYAAGAFTHATGGGRQVYTRGAARFPVSGGAPSSWNPELNSTAISLDASSKGDRVYLAGHFTQSRGRAADKAAAIGTDTENLIPWEVVFSNREGGRTGYQQAVLEVGDRVWLAGSEHSLMSYGRSDLTMRSSAITNPGGDFQALAADGSAVYAGCHCFNTSYAGATTWPDVGTGWTSAEAIYASGAWSASTGEPLPSFNPKLNTARGAGAWALLVDSTGTLWQGGDHSYSVRDGYARQWSGGFVRHDAADAEAPTTPSSPTAKAGDSGVNVSWTASSDNHAVTAYEVLRDDRVVASTTKTSVILPEVAPDARYFVRAVDAAGNRSASTAAFRAPAPDADSTERKGGPHD